ncbi:YadA-like family protein [Vibrio mediterranei]|uniref:YadA-like family protein n=1 Tax=Vibrio mediterranei TaxID=689 RepID=UPI00148B6C8E|nr:YadA-like family protein [Vibrio mediterranei]NOH29596.1 hypothetical protein [Vibrio mediterranei]
MKKVLLTLSTSLFFAGMTHAATQGERYEVKDIEDFVHSTGGYIEQSLDGKTVIYDKDNKALAMIKNNGKGQYEVMESGTNEYKTLEVDKSGEIISYDGKKVYREDPNNNEKTNPDAQDKVDTRNDISDNQKAIAEGKTWAAQAEQRFNQEVTRLDNKIDKVEGRVSNGVAMVGAMSQMQFGQGGFGIGAGAANFNGSNAIAIGAGYNFGQKEEWIIKGSFGYAETNKGNAGKIKDTMVAGGVTYTFK